MKKHYERIYAAIDLDAISHNIDIIKNKISSDTKIIAVVKTDGYGHGAVPIAKELESKSSMYGFATATAEEALILRKAGIQKPILVLGYVFPYAYEQMIQKEIRFSVFREDMLKQIEIEAAKQKKTAYVHVKVDTGMSRIGIFPDEAGIQFVSKVLKSKNVELEGVFTHFAKADYEDKTDAYKQFSLFANFCSVLEEKLNFSIPIKHCANSAAALEMPETHLDMVRAGISMYGYPPVQTDIELRPVMDWRTAVTYVKEVQPGDKVSYGCTFTADKPMTLATVACGYGDGYHRCGSGKAQVIIHGQRCPVVGRICMDQMMVDVTGIADVEPGDEAILIGASGDASITADDLGAWSGTISYEVLLAATERVHRKWINDCDE